MSDSKTPNCINCDSSQVKYDSAFGFYKCEICSETWAKDEDDPDYEDDMVYFDRTLCNTCSGGGLIQEDGELRCCPNCDGTGSN
ncbi:MAG: hypothetical protein ACYTXE_28665 [Nostoc sp.]